MNHPNIKTTGPAVVFLEIGGLTCSICAPMKMTQHDVEQFAEASCRRIAGPWQAVDKSLPPISMGEPTPGPCNQYVGRQHWFLVSR